MVKLNAWNVFLIVQNNFKVPSREVDKSEQRFWSHWNKWVAFFSLFSSHTSHLSQGDKRVLPAVQLQAVWSEGWQRCCQTSSPCHGACASQTGDQKISWQNRNLPDKKKSTWQNRNPPNMWWLVNLFKFRFHHPLVCLLLQCLQDQQLLQCHHLRKSSTWSYFNNFGIWKKLLQGANISRTKNKSLSQDQRLECLQNWNQLCQGNAKKVQLLPTPILPAHLDTREWVIRNISHSTFAIT